MTTRFLLFGAVFGFVLSRVGATRFDTVAEMFLLEDLHLMGVIGVAVALAAPALMWLRRRGIAGPAECEITLKPKPRKSGNLAGGLLFGAGWAITGTCPGTVLSQVGEGQLIALFTLTGILAGTALYRAFGGAVESLLAASSVPQGRPDPGAGKPAAQLGGGALGARAASGRPERGGSRWSRGDPRVRQRARDPRRPSREPLRAVRHARQAEWNGVRSGDRPADRARARRRCDAGAQRHGHLLLHPRPHLKDPSSGQRASLTVSVATPETNAPKPSTMTKYVLDFERLTVTAVWPSMLIAPPAQVSLMAAQSSTT